MEPRDETEIKNTVQNQLWIPFLVHGNAMGEFAN